MKEVIKHDVTEKELYLVHKLDERHSIYNDSENDTHVIVRKNPNCTVQLVSLHTSMLSKAIRYFNLYIK